MAFELCITVRGPERTVERAHGSYQERDTLATLTVPILASKAWGIYEDAVRRAVEPELLFNPTKP